MAYRILDELVFIPRPIPAADPLRKHDTSIVFNTHGSEKRLIIGCPWFARSLTPKLIGKDWPALCGVLRTGKVPLFCSVESLKSVPAATLPIRFGKRATSESLRTLELKAADAFELDCRHPTSSNWSWPAEFDSSTALATFVQTIRHASDVTTPIGISLPVGASRIDMDKCLAAEPDFLTLVDDSDASANDGALLVEGLARARRQFSDAGRADVPILLVAQASCAEHALKLLALGATAVSIDDMISGALQTSHRPNDALALGGMLSGIGGSVQPKTDLTSVARVLDGINKSLIQQMSRSNAPTLHDFNGSCLRGVTERASRLAGIPMLGGSAD